MGAGNEKETSLQERVTELSIRQRTLTGALVALRKPTLLRHCPDRLPALGWLSHWPAISELLA